jgi:predicted transcriptional regulator
MGSWFYSGYHCRMITKLPRLIRGFHPDRHQRLPDLGEREILVLEVLWESRDATAQAVKNQMPDQDISLSTVQSTLERLHRKHLAERSKHGRAFRYRAAINRSQLISGLLRDMAQHVAAGDMAPMISGFLDYLATEAPELADDLSKSLDVERAGDNSAGDDDG